MEPTVTSPATRLEGFNAEVLGFEAFAFGSSPLWFSSPRSIWGRFAQKMSPAPTTCGIFPKSAKTDSTLQTTAGDAVERKDTKYVRIGTAVVVGRWGEVARRGPPACAGEARSCTVAWGWRGPAGVAATGAMVPQAWWLQAPPRREAFEGADRSAVQ